MIALLGGVASWGTVRPVLARKHGREEAMTSSRPLYKLMMMMMMMMMMCLSVIYYLAVTFNIFSLLFLFYFIVSQYFINFLSIHVSEFLAQGNYVPKKLESPRLELGTSRSRVESSTN